MAVVLSACSAHHDCVECANKTDMFIYDMAEQNDMVYIQPEVQVTVSEASCPCQNFEPVEVDPCKCSLSSSREVLRPRIREVVTEQPRRNCPTQNQKINCGCGECDVSVLPVVQNEPAEIVPAMPEAYELAASRAFNRFVKDTFDIYKQQPNLLLYVKSASVKNDDLPDGASKGVALFKDQVLASRTFALTDDKNKNDYVLDTDVQWFDTPSKTVPAIKYVITLSDNKGKVINEWVEIVKKAENYQKWL